MTAVSTAPPLGWFAIVRLGLVQACLGALVALTTSTLNRIMVVELALPVALSAGLVAWHYAVQISRPRWGYASDVGHRRTPWIIGGMGVLGVGAVLATDAALMTPGNPVAGIGLSIAAYLLIGLGVGAAGTSLLALLATRAAPARRPAAAAITWIMMIAGIVVSSASVGGLLDPYTPQRLALIATGLALVAFLATCLAVSGVEKGDPQPAADADRPAESFRTALAEIWDDATARRFTIFVFISMLAYSAQDLILEPFAGLAFGMTPGQSTKLSGVQHAGVLLGMILVGLLGARLGSGRTGRLRPLIVAGCLGSALALVGLAMAARAGPGWPLGMNVFALGFANGVFAVSAISAMMALAGAGRGAREGVRMGAWGAAQAIAFGLGGLLGATGVDVLRGLTRDAGAAFLPVFLVEAGMFVVAAVLASRLGDPSGPRDRVFAGEAAQPAGGG